jgi:ribonuclease PH
VLDLDYAENNPPDPHTKNKHTGEGRIIEIQGTAEKTPFAEEQFLDLLRLARKGIGELCQAQKKALGKA